MESSIAVILLFVCMMSFSETSAKTNTAGISDTNQLDGDFSELSSNELSTQIDNCHEACLQKGWETCKSISPHQQAIAQNQWQLRIASMIKQEFLVATHLAWEPTNKLINCLVTWEVFGGGLTGNLLTDVANVELSLWPDTKYRVQVTCKNKDTGITVKSYPLIVDTSQAIKMKPESLSENEDNDNEISTDSDAEQSTDKYEYAENYRRRLISVNGSEERFEQILAIMLGAFAAVILVLFILIAPCCSSRHDTKTIDTHSTYSHQSNTLLNEVITVRS